MTDAFLPPELQGSAMLDDDHERLTRRLMNWSVAHCACTRPSHPHAGQVFASSTFARCCAPADTTEEERLLLAKQSLVVILADDSPQRELEAFQLYLDGGRPAGTEELSTYHRSLLDDLARRGSSTAGCAAAIRALCGGMLEEHAAIPCRLSPEQYFSIRRRTIGATPFIACWIALRNRDLGEAAARAWAELRLFELAADVIVLVNDLASLDRDCSPSVPNAVETGCNYILVRHREPARRRAPIDATIDLANRRFRQIEHRLLLLHEAAAALDEPRLLEYGHFAVQLARGNARATRHLTGRYPKAVERLERLDGLKHFLQPMPPDACHQNLWASASLEPRGRGGDRARANPAPWAKGSPSSGHRSARRTWGTSPIGS